MKVDSWSGITLIPDQDAGIQEGMKPTLDRTREHLGRADLAVVHMRALMLESIRAVEEGRDPVGIGNDFPAPEIRTVNDVISSERSWQELGLPAESALAKV